MLTPAPIALGQEAVDEVKAHVRIAGGEEDALVAGLAAGAASLCEQFTGTALIRRRFTETIPASAAWRRLRATPVTAIEGVADADGAALPAEAFAVDIDAAGDGWVRMTDGASGGRVTISYEAGLAPRWALLPDALRHGTVRLAAHFYARRDQGEAPPPAAVAALWRPWRRIRMG